MYVLELGVSESNISFSGQSVSVGGRAWQAPWAVKQAVVIDGMAILLYDYMAGPKHYQFRNLEAFTVSGERLWTAEHPGTDTVDVYVEIMSTNPFVVWNFACFRCTIDLSTGRLIDAQFAKSEPKVLHMTIEDARKRLEEFLDYQKRSFFTVSEAYIRLCELAAVIEPKELLDAIPESLRRELALIGTRPLPRREDYSTIEGVTVRPGKMQSYLQNKRERENRQYQGLLRLHEYFTKHAGNA